jgi:flavin reductase (DIM6/NTAB) family NADH-FMN oxidoreductase RutF
MVGEEPPIVMLSINRLADGTLKDTAVNIPREKEFVVHLADEPIAQQMHRCGERFAPDISELDEVGFSAMASTRVKPPRIAQAPVAFECALWETLETPSRHIFIGKVLMLHVRDELIDIETWRVRLQHYFPVGRFGASDYVTTRDRFQL